jgi:hypothetical protein
LTSFVLYGNILRIERRLEMGSRKYRRWTDEEVRVAVELYQDVSIDVGEIARSVGHPESSVVYMCNKQGAGRRARGRRRPKYPDIEIEEIRDKRESGRSWPSIAKDYGRTPAALQMLVRSRGSMPKLRVERTCALHECEKRFVAVGAGERCCCSRHLNRLLERERKGQIATQVPCALPECTKLVWAVHVSAEKPTPRYCGTEHGNLHCRRRKYGVYKRLLDDDLVCAVCGEQYVLDEHHEEFIGCKSDKTSLIHILCPKCHMKIHRGLAKYEDGKYIDMVPCILRGLREKSKIFDGYQM